MKKHIAGMVCMALAAGLCACGNGSKTDADSASEVSSTVENAALDDAKVEIEENILKAIEARNAGNYVEAEQYMQMVSEKSLSAYPSYSAGENDPLLEWGEVSYQNYTVSDATAPRWEEPVLYGVRISQNGVDKMTHLDADGKECPLAIRTYDSNGTLVEEETYYEDGTIHIQRNYNADGVTIEQTNYNGDGNAEYHLIRTCNADGRVTKEIYEDTGYNTPLTETDEYCYGENGHVKEKTTTKTGTDYNPNTRTVWTYDDYDYWKTETQYDMQGNVLRYTEAQNAYDEKGRFTDHVEYITEGERQYDHELSYRESATYDTQGNILTEVTENVIAGSYSRKVYAYDDAGNVIESTQYDKNGAMMVHEEYTYDTGRKILYKQVLPQTEKSIDGADFIANVYYYYAPKELLEKLGML